MNRIICLLLIATPIFADRVILKNGDRITGSIVKKDTKNLTFKSEVFGAIMLPWEKVESLSAEKPVFVELPGKRTVLALIDPKQDGIDIVSAAGTEDSTLSELVAIRSSDEQIAYERISAPSWAALWAGTATLGWAGARGNARALTLTADLNAARITSSDKTTAHLNAIRATALVEDVSAPTAQAVRGGWGYSRIVASRITWNAFNDYENDRFQNLDLRFVLGGGLGLIVWKRERGRLDIQGGGAYDREAFSDSTTRPAFVRNSGEAYLGHEFTFKLSPVTSVYQNARSFANLNRGGEYRINFDFGANTKLTRWLSWNASISDRYLSNPVPGRMKNDFLYSTGIGVSFSH